MQNYFYFHLDLHNTKIVFKNNLAFCFLIKERKKNTEREREAISTMGPVSPA
jgi:hypothetical protein